MGSLGNIALAERLRIAEAWLAGFNEALAAGDYAAATGMMVPDGYWRDLLGFNWEFHTCHGVAEIEARLAAQFAAFGGTAFRLEGEPGIGRLGEFGETIEFFLGFETNVATGRGHVRLIADPAEPGSFKAFTLLTAMRELKQFPELFRRDRQREEMPAPERGVENWLDQRNATREFRDRDPDVLVIGAGMAGLMAAARLGQMEISTLVVDRQERVGDIWRQRYHSLTLHNQICTNHFPYLPFPDTWPVYIPKDKIANWMEFYADAMELNVWNRTEFLGGEYDAATKRWTVRLKLADGSTRIMHPAHVVMALGVSGIPSIPQFPGIETFRGRVAHSSGQTDDFESAGKRALVVGTGTSGHDIAQDLYLRGAQVTMLQRSPTTVVGLEPASVRVFDLYRFNEGKRPLADLDFIAAAVPYDLVRRLHGPLSKQMQEDDKELLDGLRSIGFLLENGEDDTGYFLKLLRYQAGYYLNVGCSDLLIQRKIGLKSGVGIERVTETGVVFTDGTSVETDILMLATGYENQQEAIRALFGDEVAERVGPVWGIGEDGEMRAMFGRTGQDAFYVAGGGFMGCRAYTHYTARLIKARLEGLTP